VAIGGSLNWTTLESIVDTADIAYRRRFLLQKYPQLSKDDSFGFDSDEDPEVPSDADETISVLAELKEAGGPDIS